MNSNKPALYVPALGGIYSSLDGLVEPLLRVFVGLMLMPHGAQKLFGMFGGGGISGTAQFFENSGYAPAVFWVVVVGLTELVGGFAIAVGLFTRLAAALAFIEMAVLVLIHHMPNGFFVTKGGYEFALLWGIALFYFLIRGGGRYSIDAQIGKEL
jgi:putative oxidoreductase